MSRLEGRIALVTGGGRGIGRGVAQVLAEEGAAVAIVDVEEAGAIETASMLEAQGARALSIAGDVGRREDCESAVARTVEAFGGLDVLVNNAAWTPTPGLPLLEIDDAVFARVLETNLWATFWCMKAAHPHLARCGRGSIVNFASGSGTRGAETQGAYAASKEGVRGLTRVAAREWGPQGIRVNVVCPFANSPGMIEWSELDRASFEATVAQIPLRRIGDCRDDVGRVVAFLSSDEAAYVTGQTMWVDGGSGSVR